MIRALLVALALSGCAGPAPKPLTRAEVRAEWRRDYLDVKCNLDPGTHFTPCLSDDEECCRYTAGR